MNFDDVVVMPERFIQSLPFGAQYDAATGMTQFRFWAPACTRVNLVLRDAEPANASLHVDDPTASETVLAMQAQEDGWFHCAVACGPGTRYLYRLDGAEHAGLEVPDPAARAQAGDIHDPSCVVDPSHYVWQHARWRGRPWHEVVLIEVHPGLLGGFKGITKQLARWAETGFTAIELMPIADFPGARNWGYDGVLPYAPDAGLWFS